MRENLPQSRGRRRNSRDWRFECRSAPERNLVLANKVKNLERTKKIHKIPAWNYRSVVTEIIQETEGHQRPERQFGVESPQTISDPG